MPTRTRTFSVAELAAIGVPPDSPEDVEYSDHLLADEHVTTLKYTAKRRCIFSPRTTTVRTPSSTKVCSTPATTTSATCRTAMAGGATP